MKVAAIPEVRKSAEELFANLKNALAFITAQL